MIVTDTFHTCIEPPRRALAVKVFSKHGPSVTTTNPPPEAVRSALANARRHLGLPVKETR